MRVSRAFTPRRVAGLEPRICETAGRLLDAWEGRKDLDRVRGLLRLLVTPVG